MDLYTYMQALQTHLSANPPDIGGEDSILGILYEAYSETNTMYDDEIKEAFHALYESMNGIPLREMDQIVHPVCTLCRNHQKSGFIEGIRIGFSLYTELTGASRIDLG